MNINDVKHLDKFDKWGIPKQSLIIGSGTLALYGLRENFDIDVVVTVETFKSLRFERGLKFDLSKHSGVWKYYAKNIDIFGQFPYAPFPRCFLVKPVMDRAITVHGYNFMPLLDVLRTKQMRLLEHDLKDIKLIENFLNASYRKMHSQEV